MQALFVGGPLHGLVEILEDKDALVLTREGDGEDIEYFRRSGGSALGSEMALFVYDRPTYEQLVDAVSKSAMTNTAKMRVIGPQHADGAGI